MARLTQQEIEIAIQLYGEAAVRRQLQQLERQANQTESNLQGLNGRLGQIGDTLSNLPGPIGQVGSSMSGLASRAAALAGGGGLMLIPAAAAAAAAGLAVLDYRQNAAANAAAINAEKMNLTIERFQAMEYVAKQTGGEVETYRDVLNTLAERIVEVGEGSEGMTLAFARLGVSLEDIKNKTPDEQLRILIQRYDDLGRSQEASAAISEIFGDEVRNQLPMLRAGEQAIADASEKIKYYGADIDENMIKKGKLASEATSELSLAMDGFAKRVATSYGDPFAYFTKGAAEAVNQLGKLLALQGQLAQERFEGKGFFGRLAEVPGVIIDSARGVQPLKGPAPSIKLNRTSNAAGQTYKTQAQKDAEAAVKAATARAEANKKAGEAAKKAASDSASAAKAEAANKQRIADLGKQAIIDGERQLLTTQKASQEELARFETTKGRLKEIDEAQKKAVISAAQARDVAIADAEAKKKSADELKEQLRTLEQISTQAAGRLESARESAISRSSFERRSTGLGAIDRDTLANIDTVAAETARARKELEKGLSNATAEEAITKYRKELEKLNADEIATTEVLKAEAEKRKAYQADWTNGVKNAYASFMDDSNNLAGQMEQVGQKLFQGLEDSLFSFVTTGKLNFKDFARSIISDLAAIAAKQAAVGIFGSIFGGATAGFADLAGWAGPGVFAKGGAFNKGTQFFANGGVVNRATGFGMSGGRMGVMGEAGPEAIMPLTRGANGKLGVVAQGGGSGGASFQITNHITVEGSNGTAAENEELARTISAAIDKKFNENYMKANRPGGMGNRSSLLV